MKVTTWLVVSFVALLSELCPGRALAAKTFLVTENQKSALLVLPGTSHFACYASAQGNLFGSLALRSASIQFRVRNSSRVIKSMRTKSKRLRLDLDAASGASKDALKKRLAQLRNRIKATRAFINECARFSTKTCSQYDSTGVCVSQVPGGENGTPGGSPGGGGSGATPSPAPSPSRTPPSGPTPMLSVDLPAENAVFGSSNLQVTFSGHCSHNGGAITLSGPVDGATTCVSGSWSILKDLASAPEGALAILVTHRDSGGRAATAQRNISKDTTPPAIQINAGVVDCAQTPSASFGGSCSEEARSIVVSGLSSGPTSVPCQGHVWQVTSSCDSLPYSGFVLSATQVDSAGNATHVSQSFAAPRSMGFAFTQTDFAVSDSGHSIVIGKQSTPNHTALWARCYNPDTTTVVLWRSPRAPTFLLNKMA